MTDDIFPPADRTPDNLPVYRMMTGPDDHTFCEKVSAALAKGWQLYGSPSVTFNGERVIAAQAVVWPSVKIAQPHKPV